MKDTKEKRNVLSVTIMVEKRRNGIEACYVGSHGPLTSTHSASYHELTKLGTGAGN